MPSVTILQPDPDCPIDRFGTWFSECGLSMETVHLWEDPVPSIDDLADGVILLGGHMSAHEGIDHPWIEPVGWLLSEAISRDIPVMAICLGHQILAQALQGHVAVPGPLGFEGGAVEMTLTEAAVHDPIIGPVSHNQVLMGYQSHGDAVERLPRDAKLLGSSTTYNYQAYRYGSAISLQFHPEASPELMTKWHVSKGNSREPYYSVLKAVDKRVANNGRRIAYAFAAQCGADVPAI